MPTITNKQQMLAQVFSDLKKQYDPPEPENRPVLEQLIYAICREGTTRERADLAYRNLIERFFDWNEIRVSSVHEVEEALSDLPDSAARAERVIGLLQEIFEAEFSFNLDEIDKKGLKQAAKTLSKYPNANDYAIAWVIQQALGGHAIPIDGPTLRVLRRLGLVDGEPDLESLRGSLEHLIPKARGPLFNEMISLLAQDVCWEDTPNCPACPLRGECPTGQERLARNGAVEHRVGRPKPR